MVSRPVPVGWTGLRKGTASHSSVCVESASVNHEAANVWIDDVFQIIEENPARHF